MENLFCPECGTQTFEFVKYCPECGTQIDNRAERLKVIQEKLKETQLKAGEIKENMKETKQVPPANTYFQQVNKKIELISIDNSIVWLIAFFPLYIDYLENLFAVFISRLINAEFPPDKLWWVSISLIISLAISDLELLSRAGYKTKSLYVWGILFTPVYLFKRAKLLNQAKTYCWVYIFCIILSIMTALIIEDNNQRFNEYMRQLNLPNTEEAYK